jgi:hypothetical protein
MTYISRTDPRMGEQPTLLPRVVAMMRHARIPTPIADAHDAARNYLHVRRVQGNMLPEDISDLGYARVAHIGGRCVVTHRDFGQVHSFRTETEARAHIMRTFW